MGSRKAARVSDLFASGAAFCGVGGMGGRPPDLHWQSDPLPDTLGGTLSNTKVAAPCYSAMT